MAAASLAADLNPDQRRAVEHGAGQGHPPLLIIAGAGSGKTNTLAHSSLTLAVMQGARKARPSNRGGHSDHLVERHVLSPRHASVYAWFPSRSSRK
jgi:hypothetical protein